MGVDEPPTRDGVAPVAILLDRVRSLYNVGAFFRTADGAGVGKIYLGGYTGLPTQPGAAKTALGAENSVAWERCEDSAILIRGLRESGRQIAVVETSPQAVDLYDWAPRFPLCLVFGNEVDGVAEEIAALGDVHVRIPMLGLKETLNVAVAGGVVLFELLRKRRALDARGGA